MSIKDPDLQHFINEINPTKKPAFQQYRESFLQGFDWNVVKHYRPEQIIQAARTQEELIIIGEFLEQEWGRDHWWWKLYHQKRIQLGVLPSLYGTVKGKGVWGVPVEPEEYLRYKHLAGPQAVAVERRLFPKLASWGQLTGQEQLFNIQQTALGAQLRDWTSIKFPSIPKALRNALIFDIEATGLLGQEANILSFGLHETATEKTTAWYAPFKPTKKYSEVVETKIIPQYKEAIKGKELISERQIVENAIRAFESAEDTAIMGYNIKAYDIPLLYERAKKYDLHKRFEEAILKNKANIVDVAEQAQSFLSSQLGGKFLGWQEGELGLKPLGWQLGVVAESLGYKSTALAHEAAEDVAMTKFIWERLQDPLTAAKEFDIGIYKQAVEKQTGKRLLEFKPGMGRIDLSAQMLKTEEEYLRPFTSHIESVYGKRILPALAEGAPAKQNLFNKFISAKIGKQALGGILRYGGTLAAANILMPGDLAQNVSSSLVFEGVRYGAKKLGTGRIKQLAAGLGASLLFHAGWEVFNTEQSVPFSQRFSGFDDTYNIIEGLHPKGTGLGAQAIKDNTDFGSGWDPVRSLARSIYRGTKKQAFNKLRQSDEWLSMLKGAKQIKELSYGSFGTTYLMEGQFRGETIKFIKKIPESKFSEEFGAFVSGLPNKEQRLSALKQEKDVMSYMENRLSPSVYGYDKEKNELFMELMPGKTVHELIQEGQELPLEDIKRKVGKEIQVAAKKGVKNPDIHTGNIMFDPETERLSWIDWGLGKTTKSPSSEWIEQSSSEMREVAEHKLFTPISQSSKKTTAKAEGFFDDWGDLNSQSIQQAQQEVPTTVKNSLVFAQTDPIDLSRQVKRMKRFNKVATEAVGVSNRASYKAGRRHHQFTSVRSA